MLEMNEIAQWIAIFLLIAAFVWFFVFGCRSER
jgi:hypothetical protein